MFECSQTRRTTHCTYLVMYGADTVLAMNELELSMQQQNKSFIYASEHLVASCILLTAPCSDLEGLPAGLCFKQLSLAMQQVQSRRCKPWQQLGSRLDPGPGMLWCSHTHVLAMQRAPWEPSRMSPKLVGYGPSDVWVVCLAFTRELPQQNSMRCSNCPMSSSTCSSIIIPTTYLATPV